jgi:hypothetical protein
MVVRLSVFASLLMCLVVSSTVTSAPSIREIEVNGMRLSYVDEGSGAVSPPLRAQNSAAM